MEGIEPMRLIVSDSYRGLTRRALMSILLLYGTLTGVPLFYKARLSFARVPQSRSKDIKVSYSIITFLHFGAKFRRV